MYTPKLYREEDRTRIFEFLQQNDFATVIAYDGKKPIASHLLVDVNEEKGRWLVDSHMSRVNPLWKVFETQPEILIIFQGPHTYISPTWYNHINVPTWNYQAVHVYGTPRLVTDRVEAYQLLKRLTDRYEKTDRYKMETLPPDFVQKEMQGVMAFQVEVTHIDANYKLSQNRTDEDYWNIVSNLEKREDDSSHDVARAMKEQRPHC